MRFRGAGVVVSIGCSRRGREVDKKWIHVRFCWRQCGAWAGDREGKCVSSVRVAFSNEGACAGFSLAMHTVGSHV